MNKTSPAYILAFIVVVSIFFGFGVSFVHYSTLDMLSKNEALHRNRVLCRAFMLDVKEDTPEAYEQAIERSIEQTERTENGRVWHIYIRKDSVPNNVGFVFSGMGFWDRIEGIVVLSPDLKQIVNVQFLEQKETPGLGARIEEAWFTDQFKGLPIAWDKPHEERVIIGPSADPEATNRVDAITGASQTSLALMKSLNRELERFRKVYDRSPSYRDHRARGYTPSEEKDNSRSL